jgi:hypothetical protein
MSWLMFLDESGHDHKQMPYEVRGGVALHVSKLWPFVRAVQQLELNAFGAQLHLYQKELKGSTLLDKKRFKFAGQMPRMSDEERRKHCRAFLTKGLEKKTNQTREEFTAYGQACLEMAEGIFQLLQDHEARLFASAVPRGADKPPADRGENLLRKDFVFLLERFYYLLEEKREHGILVLDEVEKTADRRFVRRLERYFSMTATGRYRSHWVVPTPFFVSSDMTYAVQAADLCIYCVNLGFRLPPQGMTAPVRQELADRFAVWLDRLQFRGEGYRDGKVFRTFGIVYVPDLYEPRK